MRAVVMRVRDAFVAVEGDMCGSIASGLLAYVGVAKGDTPEDAVYLADKIAGLRIFEDEAGKMNRDVIESGGGVLVVSQFTLLADARQGRRPSFSAAADYAAAEPIYRAFIDDLRTRVPQVASGIFRTRMEVSYTNQGPVTLLLDSKKAF